MPSTDSGVPEKVDAMLSEQVVGMARNEWSASIRIDGRHGPEHAIWEMSRGGLETYRGNYSAYLQQRDERWARRDVEFEATRERFLKDLDFVKRNIASASSTGITNQTATADAR